MLAVLVLSLKLWTKFLHQDIRTTLGYVALKNIFGTVNDPSLFFMPCPPLPRF